MLLCVAVLAYKRGGQGNLRDLLFASDKTCMNQHSLKFTALTK